MGVSGSELEALKIVAQQEGESTAHAVSRKMGIDPNYARLILTSLARSDYLDLLISGRFRITPKGKGALGKK